MTVNHQVQVFGACEIWLGFMSGGGTTQAPSAFPVPEFLGYSTDGVEYEPEQFLARAQSDERGGEQGPPIEIVHLGDVYHVRLNLTKYDQAVADKVEARGGGQTLGFGMPTGTKLFGEQKFVRLILKSPTKPRTFYLAVITGAMTIARSSKFARFLCEFECHKDFYYGRIFDEGTGGVTTTTTTSTTTTTAAP